MRAKIDRRPNLNDLKVINNRIYKSTLKCPVYDKFC